MSSKSITTGELLDRMHFRIENGRIVPRIVHEWEFERPYNWFCCEICKHWYRDSRGLERHYVLDHATAESFKFDVFPRKRCVISLPYVSPTVASKAADNQDQHCCGDYVSPLKDGRFNWRIAIKTAIMQTAPSFEVGSHYHAIKRYIRDVFEVRSSVVKTKLRRKLDKGVAKGSLIWNKHDMYRLRTNKITNKRDHIPTPPDVKMRNMRDRKLKHIVKCLKPHRYLGAPQKSIWIQDDQ